MEIYILTNYKLKKLKMAKAVYAVFENKMHV